MSRPLAAVAIQEFALPYIDALRGYAILMVIATHVAISTPMLAGVMRALVDQGQRGVQLFFVVSGFTLISSWRRRHDGSWRFYIRRFFRIAPMFWLAILFFMFFSGWDPRYWAPDGITPSQVFLTTIFMHGWHPASFNSVVEGGWSIAVEFTFYLIFPILMMNIRNLKQAIVALVLFYCLSLACMHYFYLYRAFIWPDVTQDYLTWNLLNLWIINQMPVFIVGLLTYYLIEKFHNIFSRLAFNTVLYTSIFLMVVISLRPDPYNLFHQLLSIYLAFAICFGGVLFALAGGVGKLLVNRPIQYLGKLSYSAYINHFIVLRVLGQLLIQGIDRVLPQIGRATEFYILYLVLVLFFTALLSTLTFSWIEKPMIMLGKKLISSDSFARLVR
jgi:peptidoglycan/LPS O-acetylase OafA/YrhL